MSGEEKAEFKPEKSLINLEAELFRCLARTTEMLDRNISDFLKGKGLTLAQYNVLRVLSEAGSDGLTCQKVKIPMVFYDPDITRMLDRLERRKLVVRSRHPEDRRKVSSHVTQEGLDLIKSLEHLVMDIYKAQFASLSSSEIQEIIRQLTGIQNGLT